MDPKLIGTLISSALIYGVLVALVAGPCVAIASSLVAAHNNEPRWQEPARRWYTAVASWFWQRIFGSDEAKELVAHYRQVRAEEDRNYVEDSRRAMTAEDRRSLAAARRKTLRDRAEDVVGVDSRTAVSVVVWLLAFVALIPAIGGSWFLKFQVGREFLTGSENLAGIPIVIGGNLINITAVHVICGLMVLIEIVIGILIHLSIERIDQIRKEHITDGAMQYKVLLAIGLMGGFGFLVLEAVMGYVRGQMETGGDGAGTFFIIGVSLGASLVTMALAYVLKSQFKHALPFLSWFLRVPFGLVGLVLLAVPFMALLFGAAVAGVVGNMVRLREEQHQQALRESEERISAHRMNNEAAAATREREQAAAAVAEEERQEAAARRRQADAQAQKAEAERGVAQAARREADAKAAIPEATLQAQQATKARETQQAITLSEQKEAAGQTTLLAMAQARREAVQAQREQAEAEEARQRTEFNGFADRSTQMGAWLEEAEGELDNLNRQVDEAEGELEGLREEIRRLAVKAEDDEVVVSRERFITPSELSADEEPTGDHPQLVIRTPVDPSATGSFAVTQEGDLAPKK